MPCYFPIRAFRSRTLNKSGKRAIMFTRRDGYADMPLDIPCGQCVGCRLEKSRQWAVRCMHEAQMHDENCFITLTYNDEYLPKNNGLQKKHFQDFFKRLRKHYEPRKIRYFHCGEYGDNYNRPHYHAIIFGLDFRTRRDLQSSNNIVSSDILAELWPYGFNTVGDCNFESCAYVARYVLKKVTGDKALDTYNLIDYKTGEILKEIEPEYCTMSRRPGIGYDWFKKYKTDVYPSDNVIINGKETKPPKYYDYLYEKLSADLVKKIKLARQNLTDKQKAENELPRLAQREKYRLAIQKQKKRSYENV